LKTVKTLIAVPSYKGPDKHCFGQHYQFMFTLGQMQEKSPVEGVEFKFGFAEMVGNSLIGQARDILVSRAVVGGMDYIMFFDDDMMFPNDIFLRLWQHQKPWVGALAFTAREPICPVLYKFSRSYNWDRKGEDVGIDVILDYPTDRLFRVDAMGTGVVLISTEVFKKLGPAPWFHGSVSQGEDIYLCLKMWLAGIPVYCDTSVKTMHHPNEPLRWHDETYYLENKERARRFHDERKKAADNRDPVIQKLRSAAAVPAHAN
jgi:GT2 family glycosyltransferase